MEALQLSSDDVCLTLTSGGCNALNLCLQACSTSGPVEALSCCQLEAIDASA